MGMARTKWVAFLDDDDELLPCHLEFLVDLATANGADVAYGWFEVEGGSDPFPQHRGRQFDIADPHIFPITALVNRELVVEAAASFRDDPDGTGNWGVQDLPFWAALWNAGGKFVGAPDITWRWHHHGANTSGVPTRW
jgi:glycosyltransferase involved in cell wall biosynthesis